eukprot:10293269-Alexandrium_andersonii.AAC.1
MCIRDSVRAEEVLHAASRALGGRKRPHAGQVRALLVGCGRADLAKRVAALAKGRGAVAHPDPSLAGEVEAV